MYSGGNTGANNEDRQSSHVGRQPAPLVSIVIPTRNSANTIGNTLASIDNQTYKNHEIIVVDNYSTDNTTELARQYTKNVYIEAPERTAQVNFGIRKATGKYIYEVGSDFVLEPNLIEEAVSKCELEGYAALIIHNTSDETISFWAKVRKFERDMYLNDELNVAVRFIRKEIFDKVGYFDESMVAAEDYDLHNRIVAAGYKIGRINAKETHIGEPKTLKEIINKHYYYGTTIPAFLAKNPRKGVRQLSPLRPAYLRHWKAFFKHPILTLGFMIYQIARYSSAILGYAVVNAKTRILFSRHLKD
jgi:glycosyltransferase involved in cell wall biosynthesis